MNQIFYAHSLDDPNKEVWERLDVHLAEVAALSRDFAAAFDSASAGFIAGLWHDLGKYHPAFQARLDGDDASFGHAIYGAQLALRAGPAMALLYRQVATVIAGHHGGLSDRTRLSQRYQEEGRDLAAILPAIPPEILEPGPLVAPPFLLRAAASRRQQEAGVRRLEFWTRFLFSALVDADSLATERFYQGRARQAALGASASLAELRGRLDSFLADKAAAARPSEIQRLRLEILSACRAKAADAPGFFSLTVPTGGGKTFSSLAFALAHAERHGLRRVISVIPYTSILEQTAAQYALAIGRDNLIEHHSGLDPETETRRNLLASENWDSPVVVTTAVQFFESLFSNRRSACRKLHNVARSVILLDEAQTLPVELLSPVLDGLATLVEDYGCTVLFSTATQPALARSADQPDGIEGVREIVADPGALARSFRRFRVSWPASAEPVAWPALAAEIAARPQVLAIVHRRGDARDLARLLPPGDDLFHLSANLCADHRSRVIDAVKERLRRGATCRLISTQVVEAGVDIDFPVVYRAFAGLDSLVQSGGRCNREGLLPEPGELIVFRAPTQPPPGILRLGCERMEMLLGQIGGGLEITDPAIVERYFRRLYGDARRDVKGIQAMRADLAFESVAKAFHLIDDGQVGIVVPWGDAERRLDRLRREGPSRLTLRSLQPFVVSIPRRQALGARQAGLLEEVHGVLALPAVAQGLYDPVFGLDLDRAPGLPPADLWV